jgi:methyl-accepting chemotaxis protein
MAPDDKHDLISGTCSHLPKHHSTLCFPDDVNTRDYETCGRICATASQRPLHSPVEIRQGRVAGGDLFIVIDGKVVRIAKVASDVTQQQSTLERTQALLAALDKSLAVIDFQPDGTVITANQNFLTALATGWKRWSASITALL